MSNDFFTKNTIIVLSIFLIFVLFALLMVSKYVYKLYSFKKNIVKGEKDILSVNQQIKLVPSNIQHTHNTITRRNNCVGILVLALFGFSYKQLLSHQLIVSYVFMTFGGITGLLARKRWKFLLHLMEDGYLLIKNGMVHYLYVFSTPDEQRQVLTIQKKQLFWYSLLMTLAVIVGFFGTTSLLLM